MLSGAGAVQFLHGILTNEIKGLEPGQACYAAYLTPQGRMVADMDVLRCAEGLLLDVEPDVVGPLAQRLDASLFTEDVRIADESASVGSLGIYGPAAGERLQRTMQEHGASLDVPLQDRHATIAVTAGSATVLGTRRGGVEGLHLFGPGPLVRKLAETLAGLGVPTLGEMAAESLRIEGGVPRYGVDMTQDTIPLEAGIEERAISTTKGCYVGQEVIVRILHRGHGRVVRKLEGLKVEGDVVPQAGTKLVSADRDAGHVTSAVRSPRFGAIALGYVHRDFIEPGTRLRLSDSGGVDVVVTPVPFR